jgi:pyruvate/2-oxoglutarate dehydrogenase complex dihydrolipoamide acyltransferase (E2) component
MSKELNIAEVFYIKENAKKGAEALAKELNCPVALVEFQLTVAAQEKFEQERAAPEPQNPEPAPAPPPPAPESPLLKAFNRRKEGGVVSMSAAASQLGDELLKGKQKSILETRKDCVTTVR